MTLPRQPFITPTPHPPSLNCPAPAPADLNTPTLNQLSVTLIFSLQFSSCTSATAVNCVRHLIAMKLFHLPSTICCCPSLLTAAHQPAFPDMDTLNDSLWLWKIPLTASPTVLCPFPSFPTCLSSSAPSQTPSQSSLTTTRLSHRDSNSPNPTSFHGSYFLLCKGIIWIYAHINFF